MMIYEQLKEATQQCLDELDTNNSELGVLEMAGDKALQENPAYTMLLVKRVGILNNLVMYIGMSFTHAPVKYHAEYMAFLEYNKGKKKEYESLMALYAAEAEAHARPRS